MEWPEPDLRKWKGLEPGMVVHHIRFGDIELSVVTTEEWRSIIAHLADDPWIGIDSHLMKRMDCHPCYYMKATIQSVNDHSRAFALRKRHGEWELVDVESGDHPEKDSSGRWRVRR